MHLVEAPAGPDAISVDPGLWSLSAAPSTLESAARGWRDLADAADSADELISDAVRRVIGAGRWRGVTADSYDEHRKQAAAEIGHLAEDAGRVADALDELAGMLRVNQEILTGEAERLSGVPALRSQELTFQPEDEEQAELVRGAIRAAEDVRSHVDDQLVGKQWLFDAAHAQFARIADDWKPRTISMLNINIGQGYHNVPWDSGGTDHGDIGALAQTIANEDVDIVTIQEMFGEESANLERELEARTGDEWTVHFGEASTTPYFSDGMFPRGLSEPFGNAVAVRHRGAIESSEHVATHDLNAPGDTIQTPEGEITDGDPRSAVEVEITFGGQ